MLNAYMHGDVAEEQMSALLMAIFFNGLSGREMNTWTDRMIESGERLDLGDLSRPTVDKHSTGGVGDKISLILAPLVAACGAAVPQLSGRGLGHTGGTLDKLESIPGMARLPLQRRDPRTTRLGRRGDLRRRPGTGAGRSQALLAARRDRDRRVDSAHLVVDHVQEDRRRDAAPWCST